MRPFEQSFYDTFKRNTHARLQGLIREALAYGAGEADYPQLVAAARVPLHTMVGEAQLLGMLDLGKCITRLSRRLTRAEPGPPARAADLHHCYAALEALAVAMADEAGGDGVAKQAYEQALHRLDEPYGDTMRQAPASASAAHSKSSSSK